MVRAGYKQTEVGEIPEEWDVKKIEAIASITTGDKNTQDKIEDGIYPFFVRSQTIENINSYSFLITHTAHLLLYCMHKRGIPLAPQVLISRFSSLLYHLLVSDGLCHNCLL